MSNNKYAIPPLLKLQPNDAASISSMFRLYDYKSTGKIPKHLAKKLTQTLGFDAPVGNLGQEVSLKELLLFLDNWCPEHETPLQDSLYFFEKLASEHIEEQGQVITPGSIAKFMEKLGRPPVSEGEVSYISMLD